MTTDRRIDAADGSVAHIVGKRQGRPNLPDAGCPFCVGGLEAPEPYQVKAFTNRWPAFPDGRAEVVLYSPEHEATLIDLGVGGTRQVVDLWAERTRALGERDDVAYVLVFENRGPEVGATISHPHGQIYAFDRVPELPANVLARNAPVEDAGERLVARCGRWRSWVPHAATYPYSLRLTTDGGESALPALGDAAAHELAGILVDTVGRYDALFGARTPYMMWIHQHPTDGGDWPARPITIEFVTPWRSTGVHRYVAAGELGSGEFFNTVGPEEAAARLREALNA